MNLHKRNKRRMAAHMRSKAEAIVAAYRRLDATMLSMLNRRTRDTSHLRANVGVIFPTQSFGLHVQRFGRANRLPPFVTIDGLPHKPKPEDFEKMVAQINVVARRIAACGATAEEMAKAVDKAREAMTRFDDEVKKAALDKLLGK